MEEERVAMKKALRRQALERGERLQFVFQIFFEPKNWNDFNITVLGHKCTVVWSIISYQ